MTICLVARGTIGCINRFTLCHKFVFGHGLCRQELTLLFNLGDGSTVADCVARLNSGNGITVAEDCRVIGNTCDRNGLDAAIAAGIEAQGMGNLIDGNMVTDNDAGIELTTDENVIIRNTAINNGNAFVTNNYPITGTNQVGLIITTTGTINSTNPWANFSQ